MDESSITSVGDYTVGRSGSGFEREHLNTTEFREHVQFVASKILRFLKYSNIRSKLHFIKDEDCLKRIHRDAMSELHSNVSKNLTGIFADTQIIEKLNELWEITQGKPVTFKEVWRPTGDPNKDLEAHLAPIHGHYKDRLSEMLNQIRLENSEKWAEIQGLESQIQKMMDQNKATAGELIVCAQNEQTMTEELLKEMDV